MYGELVTRVNCFYSKLPKSNFVNKPAAVACLPVAVPPAQYHSQSHIIYGSDQS